jgi:Caspase domain/WD domain, G-beta repeat
LPGADFVGHEDVIWSVVPSPDGRFLLSGSADQTLRLWNLKTHELLVTLFYGLDGEWVMWTPQGYYMGSPEGAERVGWQINRGVRKEADYAAAAQLRKTFNRPDIVASAIQLASAEGAVKEAPGSGVTVEGVLSRSLPRITAISPQTGATVRGGSVKLAFNLSASKDPVKLIRISVNGTQLEDLEPQSSGGFTPGRLESSIGLTHGDNDITLIAVNTEGYESEPLRLHLIHEGEGLLDKRGTLFLVSIGVSAYPSIPGSFCTDLQGRPKRTCNLDYSGKDAAAFHEAMLAGLKPLHNTVIERLLVNAPGRQAPTADAIRDALGLLRDSKPNDTVVVFLSGHGINEGRNFLLMPTDAEWSRSEQAFRRAKAVLWSEIQTAIQNAQGRRLLFMDTCHSGNSHAGALEDAAYYANIISYYSARWDQEALEDSRYAHGLFTQAVIEGLAGKANLDGDSQITTEELRLYLDKRVPELAAELKKKQNPQFFKARDAQVYSFALVK